MRADMYKVIVERPRHGSSFLSARVAKGYKKRLRREQDDDATVSREGMSAARRYGATKKCLNEHLGPLRRFLKSRVGRPWNQVFSEICGNIRTTSAVQKHVRDHVADYVARAVFTRGGRLVAVFRSKLVDLADIARYRESIFYVCPRTGLLRNAKDLLARSSRDRRNGKSNGRHLRLW